MKSWTWSYFVTVSLSGLSFKIDVNSERKLSFQCNFCFAVKLFSDYRLRSFRMFYCEVTATNSVPFSDFTFYCLPSNIYTVKSTRLFKNC